MNNILTYFFILVSVAVSAQTSTDEAAIIDLLNTTARDYTSVSLADIAKKYWILDDKTVFSVTLKDGTHFQFDSRELLQQTNIPPQNHAEATKENFIIKVEGNMAFATCTGKAVVKATGTTLYFHEIRVLEKVEGVWKVHISSIHEFSQ